MFSILTHLAAVITGTCLGVVIAGLLSAARPGDDERHEHNHDWGA